MPQFAVYRNPGRNQAIPFVVQVQSSRLERSLGRVVVPLVLCTAASPPDHPLTPRLQVQGQDVFANPFDVATLPATRLGPLSCILPESDQDKIIRALDELVSRA